MSRKGRKLVYSTRSDAELDTDRPAQTPSKSVPPQQQTIRVLIDRKRRRGKTVTVCQGFVLTPADLKKMEKALKQYCGAGGTSKAGQESEIEIQGDHRERIMAKLADLNYKVKRVGG